MSQRDDVNRCPGGPLDEVTQSLDAAVQAPDTYWQAGASLVEATADVDGDPDAAVYYLEQNIATDHLQWHDARERRDGPLMVELEEKLIAQHEAVTFLKRVAAAKDAKDAKAPTNPGRVLIRPTVRAPRRTACSSGRPAARRTVASSSRAGPDDDPPPLPKRRARYTFACSTCPRCGGLLRLGIDGLWCANPSCPWGRS